jgi:hypothetical protein
VGISEYLESTSKAKKKYIKIQKKILWRIYFLKTANSLSGCGHINRLQVVKFSNFCLQWFLQNVYLNEAQFNIACIGLYAPYCLP